MTGQSGATSDRAYETVTDDEVARKELDEIRYRRHEAATSGRAEQCTDPGSDDEIRTSLTGLAFSGGGIRSGAICLGVLKALRRTRLLWFFDYLSTVSGGGYAGAYLSSAALCTTRAGALKYANRETPDAENSKPSESESSSSDMATQDDSHRVLKALHGGEEQSERMQDFIFGGHYLIRTRRFLNRYLIGTLMLWTLTLSGLAFLALLLSLLFRSMDAEQGRDFFAGIGFKGDIYRGFFPAFGLAVLWAICWSISYFRDGSQANGKRASYILTLLILSVGVAVAALLGNGEFGGIVLAQTTGFFTQDHLQELARLAVYGLVGVGLLPYLRPSRLIQSGARPRKTRERVVFAISSRVLVYGVPFLLVSWFARENVSGWSETRTTPRTMEKAIENAAVNERNAAVSKPGSNRNKTIAIVDAEVKDWGKKAWAPIWSELKIAHDQHRKSPSEFRGAAKSSRLLHPGVFLWSRLRSIKISPESSQQLFQSSFEDSFAILDGKIELLHKLQQRNPIPSEKPNTLIERAAIRTYALATWIPDWWSDSPTWDEVPSKYGNGPNNSIRALTNLRQNIRDTREAMTAHLDNQLKTPLLRRCNWELRVPELKEESGEDAAKQLRDAIREAELFYVAHNITETADQSEWDSAMWLRFSRLNRNLLARAYPGTIITDPNVVFASAVQQPDQAWRWHWLLCAGAVFLISALVVNVNATGLHGFYSRGLAENWIEPVPGLGRDIPLARLATTSEGLPYHLILASVHWIGRRQKQSGDLQRDKFLFSKLFCGCQKTGYVDSKDYMTGSITLPDAIAVSGAAVSPVQQGNPLVRALLWLANVRLGQWMENPQFVSSLPDGIKRIARHSPITPLRLLACSWRRAEERPHYFVSDGGHHENLGVGALFKRRCRFILSIDAGQDQDYEFSDVATLIRWARVKHGVILEPVPVSPVSESNDRSLPNDMEAWNQVSPQKSESRLEETRLTERHFILLRIRYPDRPSEEGAWLAYVKASLTGDEPVDLIRYAEMDEDFPHNSTADQFYDPDRFESYRQLGEHLIESVVKELPASMNEELCNETDTYVKALIQRMSGSDTQASVQDDSDDDSEIEETVRKAVEILGDSDAELNERQHSASVLSCHLKRPAAVKALIDALGDSEALLTNIVLDILRDIDPAEITVFYEADRGINDARSAVREQVCRLLADVLLEVEAYPSTELVTRLIEIARGGGRGSRKPERQAALFALNACRQRIASAEQRVEVDELIAGAAKA